MKLYMDVIGSLQKQWVLVGSGTPSKSSVEPEERPYLERTLFWFHVRLPALALPLRLEAS